MFNHWATGLQSELLPRIVVLQHQKPPKKEVPNWEVCKKKNVGYRRGAFKWFSQVFMRLPEVFC